MRTIIAALVASMLATPALAIPPQCDREPLKGMYVEGGPKPNPNGVYIIEFSDNVHAECRRRGITVFGLIVACTTWKTISTKNPKVTKGLYAIILSGPDSPWKTHERAHVVCPAWDHSNNPEALN